MEAQQADRILDSAGRCAAATQALFDALERRDKGELTPDEAVTVAHDYCTAKEDFDSAVQTRGII